MRTTGPRLSSVLEEFATHGLVYVVSPTGEVMAFAARTWDIVRDRSQFRGWTQHLSHGCAESAAAARKARS